MRFDMSRSNTSCQRHRLKSPQLIHKQREQFRDGNSNVFSPKVLAIGKTWMRANRYALFFGSANRVENRRRIAGMKTGGDIRRADQLEQFGVVPGAFA